MITKVDDYYSQLQKSDNDSGAAKKKVVIKKKIKLKAKPVVKKPQAPVELVREDSKQQDNTPDKIPEKKPTYQVISSTPVSWNNTSTTVRSVGSQSSSDDKKPLVKFKAGFWKAAGKISAPSANKDTNSAASKRKPKLSPYHKSRKHKWGYDDDGFVRSNKIKNKKKQEKNIEDIKQQLIDRTGETIVVPEVLSLKEFSEKIGVALPKLIAEFMKNGLMVNMNSPVDFDTACIIAEAFEVTLKKDDSAGVGIDEILSGDISEFLKEDDTSSLESRPPVISIMGHVDHGKTSLLDHIRKEKVAEGEAGGITQSIWAYQVEYENQKITFLDTPGHEAFTVMRSRGAKSTDIAILVVAADEWVKPQTLESISHAKEAGIPVIVAINKMDKEGANPDHVKGQLSEQGLTPEDWGGDTPMVPVSALTGFGIDSLLEIILLVSEIQELKANPNRQAVGTVLESHLDTQLGPVATVLINTGTINKWDNIVCNDSYGKAKVIKDYTSKAIKLWIPGDPLLIVWLDKVANGGDIIQVVSSGESARTKAMAYREALRNQQTLKSSQIDLLMMKIKSGKLKQLKVVLKSDTNGSLEAIKNSLLKLSTEETTVSIIHSGVGNVTEGDILMCEWSEAILIGFWVDIVPSAKNILEESGVEFIESRIIYHITERVEKIVTGMLDPKEEEIILGSPKVGGIFYTSSKFMILGLILGEDQKIENHTKVRVIRGDSVIGKWEILSLKQWVEEVKSVEGPVECGIKFSGDMQPQEKDILEVYKIEIH